MHFEYENINTEITPKEFEILVKEYLTNLGKELKSCKIVHDTKFETNDGTYQIDVYAEFRYLEVEFKVLIECKRHKNPIKREVVQILNDKIRTTGTHKGMIFSTTKFQEGAIKFAKIHGIALIRVIEGKYTYFTRSMDSPNFEPPEWANIPKYVGEYKIGNSINYLNKDNLNSLREFIFEK